MGDFIRLQKILAQAGFGSRRACEAFILEGRVTVDGAVIRHLGSKADPETQVVTLDGEKVAGPGKAGKRLKGQSARVYYALNKPVGVLCTNEDPSGRPLAVQMIPDKRRLFCVGRLDLDTEGLLLLTNDGELTHLLTHPRFGVPKTYVAKVSGMVSAVQLAKLKKGVFLAEGRTQGAVVRLRKKGKNTSTLELTIQEGLNRQIRRMLAAVGLQCRNLRRVRIGPLALGAMPSGAYRQLGREEVDALCRATKEKGSASPEPVASPKADEGRDWDEAPKSHERVPPKGRPVQRNRGDRDRGKKSHPRRESRPYTRSSDSDRRERSEARRPRQEKRPYARSNDSDRRERSEARRPRQEKRPYTRSSNSDSWEHGKKSRPRHEKESHTRSRDRNDRERGEQSRSYEKRPYKKRSNDRDDGERGEKRRSRSQPYKKRSHDRHDGERGEKSRSRSERPPYKKRGGDRDDRPARQERRGRPKEPGHRSKSGRGYGDERTGRGKRPAKRNEDRRSSSQERNRGRKPEQKGRGRRKDGN